MSEGQEMKSIALIAHDNKKTELTTWVATNSEILKKHNLISTSTTSNAIRAEIDLDNLTSVKSGPLGGDQQIGAMIAQGEIDLLVFFTDPLTPHPHDVDVKALTRLTTVYDIPMACSNSTADLILASKYLCY